MDPQACGIKSWILVSFQPVGYDRFVYSCALLQLRKTSLHLQGCMGGGGWWADDGSNGWLAVQGWIWRGRLVVEQRWCFHPPLPTTPCLWEDPLLPCKNIGRIALGWVYSCVDTPVNIYLCRDNLR